MSAVHRHVELNTVDVGNPPSSRNGNKWKEFQIQVHDFANLPFGRGQYIESPEFECNGLQWQLVVYPGGHHSAQEGYVCVFLKLCSSGTATLTFDTNILQKSGQKVIPPWNNRPSTFTIISGRSYGASNLVKRSDVLDPSKNILDDNGTLAFIVSIKEETEAMPTAFVPSNPFLNMIQEKFLDEETADVCFEVSSSEIEEDRSKRSRSSTSFHAHSQILNICAPMLASLFESNEDRSVKVASITDVSPDIFRHILFYVYGGRVPKEDLKAHAKSIIDAADKYSIVNLKLEAEAAYVKSTKITMDNAIDNLLYADSMNCAFLKEVVMDFLAENSTASQNLDFTNVPGHLMRDVFVAFGRKTNRGVKRGKDYDLSVMSVSELRRKLDEKGLNVDGSREAMIEALSTNNADESADAKRQRNDADDSLAE
mmetsp:Transcript_25467/g.37919  ORF Transcript_25467/g.37919 Transcript_25467/m.37919 type:complete len:426 (+) Transcript_25467:37-1314(+)